ncbi:MAG TPA: glycosyltransferase family A protein [Acidimicrobiia bacterium]|nr:glycosyltransferase family A protein [Acidimicrobiia bacterium]
MTETEPGRVSCVVVSWNVESTLGAAIESVLAQTYRPFEVLVVDAQSTDRSVRIAESFSPPVRVVSIPDNGPAANRNAGMLAARGDFLAFLDGDDLWHPEKLERHMAHFRDRPDLDCSITLVQSFWDDGHELEAEYYRDHQRMQPVPGYVMGAACVRRSALDRVGPLDESLQFADSADWFIRAEAAGLVVDMLNESLTFHRFHGTNLTRRRATEDAAEFARVLKRRLDRLRATAR